ncbi:NAD(P)-binding protein [Roseovarius sp. 2305UL8-3]|uniref:oxidoreductase n=1 Tax=Roseovarius conchicola TaxID=3121636 RepID=UPI003529617C
MTAPLFQPFTLKNTVFKNRVFSAAHEPAFTEDGMTAGRYIAYHEEKAKGGLAMSMIGGSTVVSRDSPPTFGNVDASTDRIIEWWGKLADMLHSYDCRTITHLTHLGRRTTWADPDWLPLMSASCVREQAHKQYPKAVEIEDINRIKADYVAAAIRAEQAGLDGVELMAYSQFAGSFLISNQNFRSDLYGGSVENRMRFSLEVLEEIRAAVSDDFIVGIRTTGGDPDGMSEEEALEINLRYAESGLTDYLNIVYGSVMGSEIGVSRSVPPMGTPASPHIDTLKKIRNQITVPVIHSCRVMDLGSARTALEVGAVDMVGMTRAHMADPHILAKFEAGEEHRIRPCVGAGHCIDQIYHSGAAYCIHNPATGREQTIPQLVDKGDGPARKITVVGAGPAGMEAARVCKLRGHDVKLIEASSAAGGQLLIAARSPRRRDLIGIVDWLKGELEALEVPIEYDRYVDAEDLEDDDADIIIIATGGLPNTEFFESGHDLATSSWDVLSGQAKLTGDILLYDENGAEPGIGTAEYLIAQGTVPVMITPDRMIGTHIGGTNYPAAFKSFLDAGMRMITDHRLVSLTRDGGRIRARFWCDITHQPLELTADHVVVENGTLPADDTYFGLKDNATNRGMTDIDALAELEPQAINLNPGGSYQLFRIGDAVASRSVHAAMFEARRLCMVF